MRRERGNVEQDAHLKLTAGPPEMQNERRGVSMQLVMAIGMATFVLTCAAVGLKLLTIAVRQGGLAVWSCGLAFSLIAFLGYPLPVVAGLGRGTVAEMNLPLLLVGNWSSAAGMSLFFVFTAHVFRSQQAWARGLAGLLIAAYVGVTSASSLAFLQAAPDADPFEVNWIYAIGIQLLCCVCFGWISVEGLRQWRMSRRRLALGLADPVVSNRFLMWGLFGASTFVMVLVLLTLQFLRINAGNHVLGALTMAFFGVVSSSFAALAFFPPRAYLARIRAASPS